MKATPCPRSWWTLLAPHLGRRIHIHHQDQCLLQGTLHKVTIHPDGTAHITFTDGHHTDLPQARTTTP